MSRALVAGACRACDVERPSTSGRAAQDYRLQPVASRSSRISRSTLRRSRDASCHGVFSDLYAALSDGDDVISSGSRHAKSQQQQQVRQPKGQQQAGAPAATSQQQQQQELRIHQPSEEFIALCTCQLNLLQRVMDPLPPGAGVAGGALRSAVYVRTAASLEAGALHLVRVSCSGPAAPYSEGRAAAEQRGGAVDGDNVLILGGGAAGADSVMAEESLVGQEVIVLPDNGALVVPLAHEGRFLLGLLVVERGAPLLQYGASTATAGGGGDDNGGWLTVGDQHGGSVDVSMDETEAAARLGGHSGDGGGHAMLHSMHGMSPSSALSSAASAVGHAAGGFVGGGASGGRSSDGALAPFQPLFSASDRAVLQDVARSIALACALDQRAALEAARHAANRRSLQGLIAEVREPLRTLRTLGALLVPRMDEEEDGSKRDMVDGIIKQGDRLQDVVGQLQAALHPWAHPQQQQRGVTPAPSPFLSNQQRQQPPQPQQQQQGLQAQRPTPSPAPPSSPNSDTVGGMAGDALPGLLHALKRQQQPTPTAAAAVAAAAAAAREGAGGSAWKAAPTSASAAALGSAALGGGGGGMGASGSGGVGFSSSMASARAISVPGVVSTAVVEAGGGGVALQQPPQQQPPQQQQEEEPAGSVMTEQWHAGGEAGGGVARGRGSPALAPLSRLEAVLSQLELVAGEGGEGDAGGGSSSSSSGGSEGMSASGPQGEYNVADLLAPLCAAAGKVADATGVALHVYPPLRSTPGPQATVTEVHLLDGTPVMLSRPARPLMAGIPRDALYHAVSHLLDGALQRTPRGGSVHLSARLTPGGGGIVISIRDSGASMAHRLASQLQRAMMASQQQQQRVRGVAAAAAAGGRATARSAAAASGGGQPPTLVRPPTRRISPGAACTAARLDAQESANSGGGGNAAAGSGIEEGGEEGGDGGSGAESALRAMSRGLPMGSGLVGLALAQDLIEQVGGTISVQPLDELGQDGGGSQGEGTCIDLCVPAKAWG